MGKGRERKYIAAIYFFLSLRLTVAPLLGAFVGSTTILRTIELLLVLSSFLFTFKVLRISGQFRYGRWFTFLMVALGLICAGAVIRGDFSGGAKNIVFALFGETRGLAFIIPFIILPLPNLKYFRTILNVMYFSALLAVPLWIINVGNLVQESYHGEAIGSYMPFFAAFLLGFIRCFPKRRRLIIMALFLVYLLLMVLNARRNVMISLTLYFIIALVFYLRDHIKRNKVVVVGVIFASVCAVFLFVASFGFLSENLLSNVLKRGTEDTRSYVEVMFLADLASSPASDVIFGRGMDGTYYQVTYDEITDEELTDRNVVETGYLNMVLKGGIVYVLAVVLILITAIAGGLASRDRYVSFIAVILITYLIDLYTTNPVAVFSVRSIIFWFSVSICLQYNRIKRQIC